MKFRRVLSSIILAISIIQIATLSLAAEIEEVTTDKTDEELLEYDNLVGASQIQSEKIIRDLEFTDITDTTADLTDFSNAKITFYFSTTGVLNASLTGVTAKESHYYYMYMSSDKETLSFENTKIDYESYLTLSGSREWSGFVTLEEGWECILPTDLMALSTQYYYIIVESTGAGHYVITTPKKIEKPTVNYGAKLDLYMSNINSSTPKQYLLECNKYYTRTMNYEIGKIDDIDLLKEFKNLLTESSEAELQAYKDLYTYAQKQTSLTTGSIENVGTTASFNPISKITLEENAYYYAYLSLDNENGKYYDIDDVAIYQENNGSGTLVHFAFADMVISGNSGSNGTDSDSSQTSTDDTTAKTSYPYTGKILLGTGIIALLGAAFAFYVKDKKYKGIK